MFGIPNPIPVLYLDIRVLSSKNIRTFKYFCLYLLKYADFQIFLFTFYVLSYIIEVS